MNYHIHTLEQLKPILRGLRKHAHLTQADVASMLGITQQSYAKIEANPSGTSVERIFNILRLLGAGISLHQDNLPAAQRFSKVQHYAPQVIDSPTNNGITKRLTTNPRDTATTLTSESHFHKRNKNTEVMAPPKLLPPSGKKENW
jgi:HTH-type transcriptional regulator/antitoxin HipB